MPEQNEVAAPAASLSGFAPAPVSTRLMSGSVAVRSYSESWAGDDSDILPDTVLEFTGIDMTAWTTAFLGLVDKLFAQDMAAAIAKLDPDRAASLARYKRRLAKVISQTLIPVLVVPGEVPAVEPARTLIHQSLVESLGTAYASTAGDSAPLRRCAPLPVITDACAITAQSPASIADALLWDYVVMIAMPEAVQDELLLSVVLNDPPALTDATPEARVAPQLRSDAETLFEALARTAFEYPQIAPHLAQILAGADAAVARAALERVEALIGGVTRTWPDWFAQPLPSEAVSAAAQGNWNYRIDFARCPEVSVARMPDEHGALPPWPMISGFTTPAESGQPTASYQPSTSLPAEALTFTWVSLPIIWVQQANIAASTRRNANLVPSGSPEGTLVDQAFIYQTPTAAAPESVSPSAELSSQPIPVGAGAATLSAAVDELLAPFLAAPAIAGLALRDVRIAIEAAYRASLADGIDSDMPIFRTQAILALSSTAPAEAIPVAKFRRGVIDALIAWHAAMQPEDSRAAIRFAITLSSAGADTPSPLARLGQIVAAVPGASADWWR
ncbi:MAG: hypothetical protein ABIS51_20555 [Sphingomonas sp.]